MKILLIGEFSGVHNNLKKGLTALGHEVVLAADGDGYKGFPSDIQITKYKGRIIGKILNMFRFIFKIKSFIGYDVVQINNPFSIPYYFYFFGLTHILFRLNKKICYFVGGTDPEFILAAKHFDYFPFDNPHSSEWPKYNRLTLIHNRWFLRNVDCIIPANYLYAKAYMDSGKLTPYVPYPGSGSYYEENLDIGGKIQILYARTRDDFKGSEFILPALEIIKERYKALVNVLVVIRLPYKEYQNVLINADIVVDQCKSYDYGMNALFALELGKVVLSGAEPIAMDYFGEKDIPIINIKPDVQDIVFQLSRLIDNPELIVRLKKDGLEYVKRKHHPKSIAGMWLKTVLEGK